jgi:hypothetical protein
LHGTFFEDFMSCRKKNYSIGAISTPTVYRKSLNETNPSLSRSSQSKSS